MELSLLILVWLGSSSDFCFVILVSTVSLSLRMNDRFKMNVVYSIIFNSNSQFGSWEYLIGDSWFCCCSLWRVKARSFNHLLLDLLWPRCKPLSSSNKTRLHYLLDGRLNHPAITHSFAASSWCDFLFLQTLQSPTEDARKRALTYLFFFCVVRDENIEMRQHRDKMGEWKG